MAIFESLFDLLYLGLVLALGIRLLVERQKTAKLFGVMAIILGLGDAFHLLPRIIAHLSPLGFEGHAFALSWGQFITSITMTIFYLLFYYFYRHQSDDTDKKKLIVVYALVALRIALVLLPQNQWGQMPGNYLFGILRNLPFAILGALLISWTYKARDKAGLKHMWLLILLSFLFYIPVVLFSAQFPIVGALMMPKTTVYLLIVVFAYKYFVGPFTASHILGTAFSFVIIGLFVGAFYREFTKFYAYTAVTHLGKMHVHALVLGVVVLSLVYLLCKSSPHDFIKKMQKPLYIYLSGLTLTLVSMMCIGIYEVVSLGQKTISRAALDGMSGLGHIILSVGFVWTFAKIFKNEKGKVQV